MKLLMSFILSAVVFSAFAHDGGHGPAIKDESLYGGKVTAIISADEVNKGRDAKMLYKGELVHSSRDLDVKVYIYDLNMKPVDLKAFSNKINAVLLERNAEKKFELTLDKSGKFFSGMREKNKRVPFNIDINLSKGDKKLFGAFDGLD